jgi:1-acyl-sn-glycerol-3-phosphate acyltransferase
MFYAVGIVLWITLSLLTMGVLCFFCALLFWVTPNKTTHAMMWFFYVHWTKMLGWWVKKLVPNIQEINHNELPAGKPFVVVSNHYSWVDIIILYTTIYSRKTAFVFVMKRSLIKLPMIGIICWGLGHPLIYRGKARRKNLFVLQDSAKRAVAYNYGIMIFPEGTRYTKSEGKPKRYSHLLTPRTIGFQKLIESMGGSASVLDVTLKYGNAQHKVIDFLQGNLGKVEVYTKTQQVTAEEASAWILATWAEKDQLLQQETQELLDND